METSTKALRNWLCPGNKPPMVGIACTGSLVLGLASPISDVGLAALTNWYNTAGWYCLDQNVGDIPIPMYTSVQHLSYCC